MIRLHEIVGYGEEGSIPGRQPLPVYSRARFDQNSITQVPGAYALPNS
jgi:hypothetical protein